MRVGGARSRLTAIGAKQGRQCIIAPSPQNGNPSWSRRVGSQAPRSSHTYPAIARTHTDLGGAKGLHATRRTRKFVPWNQPPRTIGNANYIDSKSVTRLWNPPNFRLARRWEGRGESRQRQEPKTGVRTGPSYGQVEPRMAEAGRTSSSAAEAAGRGTKHGARQATASFSRLRSLWIWPRA